MGRRLIEDVEAVSAALPTAQSWTQGHLTSYDGSQHCLVGAIRATVPLGRRRGVKRLLVKLLREGEVGDHGRRQLAPGSTGGPFLFTMLQNYNDVRGWRSVRSLLDDAVERAHGRPILRERAVMRQPALVAPSMDEIKREVRVEVVRELAAVRAEIDAAHDHDLVNV